MNLGILLLITLAAAGGISLSVISFFKYMNNKYPYKDSYSSIGSAKK